MMTERNIFAITAKIAGIISHNGIPDTHGTLLDDIISAIVFEFPEEYPQDKLVVSAKIQLIIKTVARIYGVNISDIYEKKGVDGVRDARNMVYYLIREHTNLTYPQIAATMQKKAHATIISGTKRVKGFLKVGDPYTTKKYKEIKRILNL